jgi:hypothetical protein
VISNKQSIRGQKANFEEEILDKVIPIIYKTGLWIGLLWRGCRYSQCPCIIIGISARRS